MLSVEFLFLLVLKQLSVLFCKRDEYSKGIVNKRLSISPQVPPLRLAMKRSSSLRVYHPLQLITCPVLLKIIIPSCLIIKAIVCIFAPRNL